MEVRELKIGNWVKDQGVYVKVWGVNYIQKEDLEIVNGAPDYQFSPIPLTESLFKQLGRYCEKKKIYYLDSINDACDSYNLEYWSNRFFFNLDDEEDDSLSVEIKYIHELQNLVYCHTKKELEIKF